MTRHSPQLDLPRPLLETQELHEASRRRQRFLAGSSQSPGIAALLAHSARLTALATWATLASCAPVRRADIDRGTLTETTPTGGQPSESPCLDVQTRSEGGTSIPILNMPSDQARVLHTVLPGTRLRLFAQSGSGTPEFPQVTLIDAQGKTFGAPGSNERLFIQRKYLECATSGAAKNGQEGGSGPGTSDSMTGGSTPPTSSAIRGSVTPSAPPNATIATSVCKVEKPFWQRLMWLITPECTRADGTKLSLPDQSRVTIRQLLEPGTPSRYFEVTKKCTVPEENIDKKSCSPALPAAGKSQP